MCTVWNSLKVAVPQFDTQGVRGRMSAVTREDRGSVNSCFNLLGTALKVCTNSEMKIPYWSKLNCIFSKKINMYTTLNATV